MKCDKCGKEITEEEAVQWKLLLKMYRSSSAPSIIWDSLTWCKTCWKPIEKKYNFGIKWIPM